MLLPACDENELLKDFEIYRKSVNKDLGDYFRCLDRHSQRDNLPGLKCILKNTQINEGAEIADLSALNNVSARVMQELSVLNDILQEPQRREQHLVEYMSPSLASWTASCLILAYAVPHSALSMAFVLGTSAGTGLLIMQLVRKYLRLRELAPLQHKVQGLIRAFKNGTIRYRDLDEVLISSLG
ncbi:hypothetical protein FLONG3_6638 [Fusarium longipes]|uniref:Uncharacterized protein n=1 Tax=Fusarium longipes TaxID=694270 RepID=A0A395SJM1_9HYPO|nr:hypothetical protein FLONG3_6638 [Fusarium longipes]